MTKQTYRVEIFPERGAGDWNNEEYSSFEEMVERVTKDVQEAAQVNGEHMYANVFLPGDDLQIFHESVFSISTYELELLEEFSFE